jgi:hypothetical protein
MTYQAPMNPSMQPQAPPPPPVDDAARGKFISLMKSINPETDLMFGRLQGYQGGGFVEGLGTLGTLEEDPLGTLGDLGIPKTPKAPLPAATPFPVQGKIGVPGFKGQFFKEEDVRGTRFPAFAPALRAEVEEESTRGAGSAGTIPIPGSGIHTGATIPIQKLGLKAAETGIEALSPYYEKLKEGLKAGTYDVLKGTEAGDNLIKFLGLEPSAETDPRIISTGQAAYTDAGPPSVAGILEPSGMEIARAALDIVAMKDAGKTNAEIIERVGGMYGTDRAVQIFNAYNKVPGRPQIPGAAIAILAGDIIGEGKITGPAAGAAFTTGIGEIITQSLLTNAALAAEAAAAAGGVGAIGVTGASAGATLGAYAAGAVPAIVMTAAKMHAAKRDAFRARRSAEDRAFSAGIVSFHPDKGDIEHSTGHTAKDINALFKEDWESEYNYLGQQLNEELGNRFHHGDESTRKMAQRNLGVIQKYRQKIPAYDSAWIQFMGGKITRGQFETQSQRAINSYVIDKLGGKRELKPGEVRVADRRHAVGGAYRPSQIIDLSNELGRWQYYRLTGQAPPGYGVTPEVETEGDTMYNLAARAEARRREEEDA